MSADHTEQFGEANMLENPICIIGAARSGTTLLIDLLSQHPDAAVLKEPKYLWRYRRPTAAHDKRTANEATPHVRNYIRSKLAQHVEQQDGSFLVEKTPSNCFRVPFIHAVLPEVRFVHIVRDGRDVAFSAREQWRLVNSNDGKTADGDAPPRRLITDAWSRMRSGSVPLVDLPLYASKFAKTLWRNVVTLKTSDSRVNVWGPKFPGIQETAKTHDLLETCAIQWRESVRAAHTGLASVPDRQKLHLRFEDLVQHPAKVIRTVLGFAEFTASEKIIDYAKRTTDPEAAHRWRDRPSDVVERVMEEVGPFVRELNDGYL